jgi:cation:H+ antiporter
LLPTICLFVFGLIIIIKGGDLFVDAAVWIAKKSGIPNIIIGATIVSLATTLPELFVSMMASYRGAPDVALGNALGSTICNMGLITAISMFFAPGKVETATLLKKGGLMILAVIILFALAFNRHVAWYEGVILLLLLGVYIYINFKELNQSGKKKAFQEAASAADAALEDRDLLKPEYTWINIAKFIGGAILIIIGAKLLVDNGIKLASFLGVPQSIIALTIIALGTSLPELTTCIVAILKKHHGISLGNILGANILNLTMILGGSSLVSGEGLVINTVNLNFLGMAFSNVPQTLYVDIPVSLLMMFVMVIPSCLSGRIKRWQGVALLGVYLFYLTFLAVNFL